MVQKYAAEITSQLRHLSHAITCEDRNAETRATQQLAESLSKQESSGLLTGSTELRVLRLKLDDELQNLATTISMHNKKPMVGSPWPTPQEWLGSAKRCSEKGY